MAEQEIRVATPDGEMRQELADHGVRGTVERLERTEHGYAMADLPVYDAAAAERHFSQTLELWRRNLAPERVGA